MQFVAFHSVERFALLSACTRRSAFQFKSANIFADSVVNVDAEVAAMPAYEARVLLHSTLSSARQSFTDVQVRESRTRGRIALREVQEDNDAAAEQEESKKKRTMKFKQPAAAGKQQAAARNRSRARACAGARSEPFFLEPRFAQVAGCLRTL